MSRTREQISGPLTLEEVDTSKVWLDGRESHTARNPQWDKDYHPYF